jgi:hypothetical protein
LGPGVGEGEYEREYGEYGEGESEGAPRKKLSRDGSRDGASMDAAATATAVLAAGVGTASTGRADGARSPESIFF